METMSVVLANWRRAVNAAEEMDFETTEGVKAIASFEEMGIKDDLLRGIYQYGFEKPSAIQQRAVTPIIQGCDIIAHAQSGTDHAMALFSNNLSAMDFFFSPQNGYPRHSDLPILVKSSSREESKASQLTIFYDGQVVVFDDFPADKVAELMSLASKVVSQSQNSSTAFVDTTPYQQANNPPSIFPQPPPTPIVCEMPVARKNSLHRFLAKRKNRIVAKAPYQKENLNSAPNNPA